MKKKLFCILMSLAMVIGMLPITAAAEEPDEPGVSAAEIYVSASGSDTSDGTANSPFATLKKAVEAAPDGAVIYVMSDLISTECARFYNKNLTIKSGEGGPYTVKRGDSFKTQADNSRSWYNPGMIEVGGIENGETGTLGKSTLRIENLILDDARKTEGTKFGFASTTGAGGNPDYVQDSIIASYSGTGTVYLGSGAVLKNPGGMSAVYITGPGKLVMEKGSVICDDEETAAITGKHCFGVYLIGSEMVMQNGAEIKNLKGLQAVNVVGAKCTINGDVSGNVCTSEPTVRVENGYLELGSKGTITGNNTPTISSVYALKGSEVHIYGKISGNMAPAGALYVVTNGDSSHAYMYKGAEITDNTSTGKYGVIEVQQGNCSFTMNGGTISGNTAKIAGAVQLRKGSAMFVMNGGTIKDNVLMEGATGDAGLFITEGDNLTVKLNGGTLQSVTLDTADIGKTASGHISIADGFVLENGCVKMRQDKKDIFIDKSFFDIKISNASKKSLDRLTSESAARGWTAPKASLWAEKNSSAALDIAGLSINAELPVYLMTVKTDSTGAPAENAEVNVYRASVFDGKVGITLLPSDFNDNGCAAAVVQPSADYGILSLSAPSIIKENKKAAEYSVDYKAEYELSQNLASQIKAGQEFDAEISLDAALNCDVEGVKISSDVFELKENSVSYDAATGILKLGLTAKQAAAGKASVEFKAVLPAGSFEPEKILFASGTVKTTVNEQTTAVIPSNIAETELVPAVQYTVVFDANNENAEGGYPAKVKVYENETLGDTMPAAPSLGGYRFDGWNTKADGSGTVFDGNTAVTDNITVYAQWKKVSKPPVKDEIVDIEDEDVPLANLGLNNTDHFAYIEGYEDGTIRPERNITRAEVAAVFFRLMTDNYRNVYWSEECSYSDVPGGKWFTNEVATMEKAGIILGYPDGSFKPGRNITRAEFASMAARFLPKDTVPQVNAFSDVKDHWAKDLIETAASAGWIQGYNGEFRPDDNITRAEAITIVNRMVERAAKSENMLPDMVNWPDNQPGSWYYEAVQEATNSHDYERLDVKVPGLDYFYENWTRLYETPDWAELEKAWSEINKSN